MHSDLMHGFDGQQIGSNVQVILTGRQVILTGSLVDIVYSILGSFRKLFVDHGKPLSNFAASCLFLARHFKGR